MCFSSCDLNVLLYRMMCVQSLFSHSSAEGGVGVSLFSLLNLSLVSMFKVILWQHKEKCGSVCKSHKCDEETWVHRCTLTENWTLYTVRLKTCLEGIFKLLAEIYDSASLNNRRCLSCHRKVLSKIICFYLWLSSRLQYNFLCYCKYEYAKIFFLLISYTVMSINVVF